MSLEIGHQLTAISGALVALAEAVDLQPQVAEPQGVPQTPGQQYDLLIDVRPREPEDLDADLMKLAVAALLRTLVPKHGAVVPEAPRRGEQTVLNGRTHATRGALGAQAEAVAVAVGEAVHLLLDDVGNRADGTFEQVRHLHQGRADLLVTIAFEDGPGAVFQGLPKGDPFREDVVHPPDCLDSLRHGLLIVSGGVVGVLTTT